jgi:phosphate/sulfate permease
MCVLAKVDTLSFWKKYRPRAPIMDKISAAMLLEGSLRVGWPVSTTHTAQVDHSA